jgi:hypothetical protein
MKPSKLMFPKMANAKSTKSHITAAIPNNRIPKINSTIPPAFPFQSSGDFFIARLAMEAKMNEKKRNGA